MDSRRAASTILVTGASGFLGRTVSTTLETRGFRVLRGCRELPVAASSAGWVAHGPVGARTDWSNALEGIDAVVHLAGVAHLPDRAPESQVAEIDEVNARGTAHLVRTAAESGVRRFVFMSTALVHGADSGDRPIIESDPIRPLGAYARSKVAAEQEVERIAGQLGIEHVILRPPMVYGPGAAGNFRRLCNLVRSGWPLPLGRATAPRSFLGIDNLADAVAHCVVHPGAANASFLVCDSGTLSTAVFVRELAAAMGRRASLLPVPPHLVGLGLRLLGRGRDYTRLFARFNISNQRLLEKVGWSPPDSLSQGLRRAVGECAVDRQHRE